VDGGMKISTMKKIDRWVGLPACALLQAVDSLRGEPLAPRVERILVVKFWGMGSMILALPVFRALREAYPQAQIAFATIDRNREFVDMLKVSDQEIYLSLPKNPLAVFAAIFSFFFRLRRFRPNLVIDLEYLTRFSALATYFSGAEKRVGFHSWDVWRGELHNLHVPFSPYWHASENFLNLARKAAGRDFKLNFDFSLPENQDARQRMKKILAEAGLADEKNLILVNPNASTIALERRWPPEHFLQLIQMVLDAGLGVPVLIGAPDERPFVEGLRARLKAPEKVADLAGKLKLDEFIELVRGARLLITNDSGPLHIAELLHTRTVSFFGPETPVLFGPLGDGHKVLYKGIDCSPCITIYNAKTVRCIRKTPECVSSISPEEAFLAVKDAAGQG
jgi:lipopolysaccharide heptosyltransferase II